MFECYTVVPCDECMAAAYASRALFPQSEASTLPCTRGSIIYTPQMLAAIMEHQIAAWIREKDFPWKVAFDFALMKERDQGTPVLLREFLPKAS